MKILTDYLNESMYSHIQLQDHIKSMINEKHGSYEGCEKQSKMIAKIVSDACYQTDNDFSGDIYPEDVFNKDTINVFYKQIRIIVKRNHTGNVICSYNSETSKLTYLYDENKIGIVEINMNIPIVSNFKNIKMDIITPKLTTQLQHELTHAWEDYNRLLNNKESLFDLIKKDTSYKLPNNYDIVSEYNYFFNKHEQNAYIYEFKAYLEQHPIKIKEYDENVSKKLYDVIRQTTIYKKYMCLINNIINIKDADVSQFKKLDKFSSVSNNKIKKHLINDVEKLRRKLENILPKIIYDYIEITFYKPIM